jgi:ATP/maltotriose-dependent transcriptional regulator MalT
VSALTNGRRCCEQRNWEDAYRWLAQADATQVLEAQDLERLFTAAYMLQREEEALLFLERAHQAHVEHADVLAAARTACWLGLHLAFAGQTGPASGWFGRAARSLQDRSEPCVEQGYLLLPKVHVLQGAGNKDAALATAAEAATIGERFGDQELVACARHLQGRVSIALGRVDEGLTLLDEAMVHVLSDRLSPIMAGLVYCSVIEACQQVFALTRARQWTEALQRWCEAQRGIVAFTGKCLIHRAEVLQVGGDWTAALDEARSAAQRLATGTSRRPPGLACYQEAEVLRLRGEARAAEDAYKRAGQAGVDPQPGLALLRFAQGKSDAAASALRRAVGSSSDPISRIRLLPALAEILVAGGELAEARAACDEFEALIQHFDTPALTALASFVRALVELAEGAAEAACKSAYESAAGWHDVGCPYGEARAQIVCALACEALHDDDGCQAACDAAQATFERLGARDDLARLQALRGKSSTHGLTPRELEVLRLVAKGKTNKAIAKELFLSVKTIDRHLSNIFCKLGVSSRAAATAYVYEHGLS